jgi:hypothetical protein
VERVVADSLRRTCKAFNQRRPEVVVIAHEADPRAGAAAMAAASRRQDDRYTDVRGDGSGGGYGAPQGQRQQRDGGGRGGRGQQWQQQRGGQPPRGQPQQLSEREADELLAERKRRRQADRERDLLSAPKGAELDDLGGISTGGCA